MSKQKDLLMEFQEKCRKQFTVPVPKDVTECFVNGNSLKLNLDKVNSQNKIFLPFLLSLPFKHIHIFKDQHLQTQPFNQSGFYEDEKSLNQIKTLESILKTLTQLLQNHKNKHLRSLKFQNIPFLSNHLQIISPSIKKAKYLKQLSLINCSLNDSHIQTLKHSLIQNVSLNSIDFSFNKLEQIGQFILQILYKHAQRKRNILELHQRNNKIPQFNISNTGIYQINLEGNGVSSKSINQILHFLQHDQWVKSINLKQNQLQQQEINKFSSLLQSNHTLLNLDLRLNPGFNKKYSKIIFYRLKHNLSLHKTNNVNKKMQNIHKKNIHTTSNNAQFSTLENQSQFKLLSEYHKAKLQKTQKLKTKQFPQFNKQLTKSDHFSNRLKKNLTAKILIKSPERFKNPSNHHSHRKPTNSANKSNEHQLSNFSKTQKQNQTLQIHNIKNTLFISQDEKNKLKGSKKSLKVSSDEAIQCPDCQKCCFLRKRLIQAQKRCNEMHIRTLKAQKQNLQLQIELKKLKIFIQKNRDVSVIGTSANKIAIQNLPQLSNQNSNISTSFNRILGSQNEEEMISRIEVLVTELTRIMQTVQQFQNTQNTIQHPFSNVNSFSKTVSLYERRQQLMEIQQQILEDQALHLEQFGDGSITMIQNSQGVQGRNMKMYLGENIQKQQESLINL